MARVETWVGCDLNKAVQVRQLGGFLFTQDNEGNLLGAKVTQDGEPVELTGTVVGYAILADGQTVDITGDSTGIQNGNEAFIVLPQLAYSVPGQISIVIKLTTADTITTLAAFCGYVYRSKTGSEVVPPGTPIPDLSTLEEAIRNANTAATAANTAAAAAENVDITMSQDGDAITITTTDRQGETETATLTDQSEAVSSLKSAFEQLNDNVITESAGPSPIVSIADGADGMPMRKVEVAIEPAQDLHGYDSPWPGGSGKNLLPNMDSSSKTLGGVLFTLRDDGGISVSGTATSTVSVVFVDFTLPAGSYKFSNVGSTIQATGTTGTFYVRDIDNSATLTSVAIGSIIQSGVAFTLSATTNVRFYATIQSGTVYSGIIYPMISIGENTNTDYAPYSNICPISGWTGAKVTRTGKNLIGPSDFHLNKNYDGNTVTGRSIAIVALPYGQYTISLTDASLFREFTVARCKKPYPFATLIAGGLNGNANLLSAGHATYTINDTYPYVYVICIKNSGETTVEDIASAGIQLETGSATAYEPYQGQIYEVTFPSEAGTVYGGTLDAVSGKLVVDRALTDLGSLNWMYNGNSNFNMRSLTSLDNVVAPLNSTSPVDAICTSYPVLAYQMVADTDKSLTIVFTGTTAGRVWVHDSSYSDALEFKTAMSGVMLCHKLLIPQVITLTTTEIKTLLGINNVWADAGNTAINYPADTKMYIDRKITEAVANALNA